ncbi:AraC family transcriptional regulator [Sphingomonas bacterium]|uniref:helix-turn-helix domain-containing protein n=1 Tax=Sphingomonas bacterium TaxID=1895847 RepID=UPI0015754F8A|nr:helix-turn-helix transcriptional regulator [Sphingomonas bacterium]
MDIAKSRPDDRLAPYVRHYVSRRARLGGELVRIALPARTQVILEFYFAAPHLVEIVSTGTRERAPTAVVVGPQTFRRVDLLLSGIVEVFTVQFTPTGLHALFGIPMRHAIDTAMVAEDLLGAALIRPLHDRLATAPDHAARTAICDDVLLAYRQLHRPTATPSIASRIVAAIERGRGTATVADLSIAAGLSPRQLRRLFDAEVGMAPKLYARIVRLDAALTAHRATPDRSWTDIAHDLGWFDQAHLDKDFRALAGSTPTDFPI